MPRGGAAGEAEAEEGGGRCGQDRASLCLCRVTLLSPPGSGAGAAAEQEEEEEAKEGGMRSGRHIEVAVAAEFEQVPSSPSLLLSRLKLNDTHDHEP